MADQIFTTLFGRIDASGNAQSRTGEWVVERTSKGHYALAYDKSYEFKYAPTVVCTGVSEEDDQARIVTVYNSTPEGFEVLIKSAASNEHDCDWNFFATYEND